MLVPRGAITQTDKSSAERDLTPRGLPKDPVRPDVPDPGYL
jgi:hypothetical protein